MNKAELITSIADSIDESKAIITKVVNSLLDVVTDELKTGGEVALVGFGSFVVKDRAARTARNPQTGDLMEIKATKVPAFKAGKALKTAVAEDQK